MTNQIFARSVDHATSNGPSEQRNNFKGEYMPKKRGRPRRQDTESKPKTEPIRSSFLPEPLKESPPVIAETEPVKVLQQGDDEGKVSLQIQIAADRNAQITLTLPPLRPCIEKVFLPLDASSEQYAAVLAGAIERAARSAAADGIYQHAVKQNEERQAKERYAARG